MHSYDMVHGNKMNLLEILRRKKMDSSTCKGSQSTIFPHVTKPLRSSREELKKYIMQHPKTNLISLLKDKKRIEDDSTPESARHLKERIKQYYENEGTQVVLSPIQRDFQSRKKSVSEESGFQITMPKHAITGPLQLVNSQQNSIAESPSELESSFVVGADNVSKLDPEEYSLRVYNLDVSRLNRSQSQFQENTVKPFMALSDQMTSPMKNTLSIPMSQRGVQRKQSLSVVESGNPRLRVANSIEQRKSVRLMRGSSGVQAKETSVLERTIDEAGRKRFNNYIILHELGRGGFGKVKLVYDPDQQQYFALKIADKSKLKRKFLTKSTSAYSLLEQEIAILKKIDHPNNVKLFEVIDDPEERKLYLIMEYVKKGSINSKAYWKAEGVNVNWEDGELPPKISLDKIRKYLRDFLMGLDYLHNFSRIVHRDIKPDNLLIDSDDHLKIADFGVAQMIENTQNDLIQGELGTKAFLPPEMFRNQQVKGKPADIWATGVTFFIITQGTTPFQAKTVAKLKELVMGEEVQYPADIDPDFKDFLQCCLRKDQRQRSTLEQLMDHPFVTENGQNMMLEQEYDQNFIISEQEVSRAISKLTVKTSVRVTAKLKVKLTQSRQRIKSRTIMIK